jgi:hypothetical protein
VFVHVVDERFELINVREKARTAGASDAIDRLGTATVAAHATCIDDSQFTQGKKMAVQISVGQAAR